jgi:hypothetical protein
MRDVNSALISRPAAVDSGRFTVQLNSELTARGTLLSSSGDDASLIASASASASTGDAGAAAEGSAGRLPRCHAASSPLMNSVLDAPARDTSRAASAASPLAFRRAASCDTA